MSPPSTYNNIQGITAQNERQTKNNLTNIAHFRFLYMKFGRNNICIKINTELFEFRRENKLALFYTCKLKLK